MQATNPVPQHFIGSFTGSHSFPLSEHPSLRGDIVRAGTAEICKKKGRILTKSRNMAFTKSCRAEGRNAVECISLRIMESRGIYIISTILGKWGATL